MTDPDAKDFRSVRIKKERVDDEYENGSHVSSRADSSSSLVYIDNALDSLSPRHEIRASIMIEAVDADFTAKEHSQNHEDSVIDVDEYSSESDTDDCGIRKSHKNWHGWRIVKTFDLGFRARYCKDDDVKKSIDPIHSDNLRDSRKGKNKAAPEVTVIKKEIHDEEYDKLAQSFNRNSGNLYDEQSFNEVVSSPARKKENDCEPPDDDGDDDNRHSEASANDHNESSPSYNEGASVTEKNKDHDLDTTAVSNNTGSLRDQTEDSIVRSSGGEHGPDRVASSGGTVISQLRADDDFQTEIDNYGTGQHMETMTESEPEEEVSDYSTPCQLLENQIPISNQVTSTLCQSSQPTSYRVSNDSTAHNAQQCTAYQEEEQSPWVQTSDRDTQDPHSVPGKSYTCAVCFAEFQFRKDLKIHSRVHKKKYRCYSKLLNRMNAKSNTVVSDLFGCRYCNKSFTFAADLTKHMKKHEEQKWYEQQILKYNSDGSRDNSESLSWNQKSVTNQQQESAASMSGDHVYACKVCNTVFSTLLALQLHMHQPERPLISDNCRTDVTRICRLIPTPRIQKRSMDLSGSQSLQENLLRVEPSDEKRCTQLTRLQSCSELLTTEPDRSRPILMNDTQERSDQLTQQKSVEKLPGTEIRILRIAPDTQEGSALSIHPHSFPKSLSTESSGLIPELVPQTLSAQLNQSLTFKKKMIGAEPNNIRLVVNALSLESKAPSTESSISGLEPDTEKRSAQLSQTQPFSKSLGTETGFLRILPDAQKRFAQLSQPQTFLKILGTESNIARLALDTQNQSAQLTGPELSVKRDQSAQDRMNGTNGSWEASGDTVGDGEHSKKDKAVLNMGLPIKLTLCGHRIMDADKCQPILDGASQTEKDKETAGNIPWLSLLAAVSNEIENTNRDSPVSNIKHSKKHTSSVQSNNKKRKGSCADVEHPSLKRRHDSSETIGSMKNSHTTVTANSMGKPVLDNKTITGNSPDNQVFLSRRSYSKSSQAAVRKVQNSTEPCSVNSEVVHQPAIRTSNDICQEHNDEKYAFSGQIIHGREGAWQLYQPVAPTVHPPWYGLSRTTDRKNGHENVTDTWNAVSACGSCPRKTYRSQHLEESRDASVATSSVFASPLNHTCPACDTPFRPDISSRDQPGNSGDVDEAIDTASELLALRHLNRVRISRAKRRFTCHYCQTIFDTPQGLSAHQRVHIKVRPYNCYQCSKRFRTRSDLLTHSREHSGNASQCGFCKTLFPTDKGLRIHQSRNEQEKPGAQCTGVIGANLAPANTCAQVSVPVKDSVNGSSSRDSPLLAGSVSTCETTSLKMKVVSEMETDLACTGESSEEEPFTESLKMKSSPVPHDHDKDNVSIAKATPGSSLDRSSETFKGFPLVLTPKTCLNRPVHSDKAAGGNAADVRSAGEQSSPEQQESPRRASSQNDWSGQDRKHHRNNQHTGRCQSRCASPDKAPLSDHGETTQSGSTCVKNHQEKRCEDASSNSSPRTGSNLEDVPARCTFCTEHPCSTFCPAKKKREEITDNSTVSQVQAAGATYMCVECSLAFANRGSLEDHLGFDPSIAFVTCSRCGKTFLCCTALKKHVKTHFSSFASSTSHSESPLDLSLRGANVRRPSTPDSSPESDIKIVKPDSPTNINATLTRENRSDSNARISIDVISHNIPDCVAKNNTAIIRQNVPEFAAKTNTTVLRQSIPGFPAETSAASAGHIAPDFVASIAKSRNPMDLLEKTHFCSQNTDDFHAKTSTTFIRQNSQAFSDKSSTICVPQNAHNFPAQPRTFIHQNTQDFRDKTTAVSQNTPDLSAKTNAILTLSEAPAQTAITRHIVPEMYAKTTASKKNMRDFPAETTIIVQNTSDFPVRNTVSMQNTPDFPVRNTVAEQNTPEIHIRNTVTEQNSPYLTVRNTVAEQRTPDFSVRNTVAEQNTPHFPVGNTVGEQTTPDFSVRNTVAKQNTHDFPVGRYTVAMQNTPDFPMNSTTVISDYLATTKRKGKPVTCFVCGRFFADRRGLSSHERSHFRTIDGNDTVTAMNRRKRRKKKHNW